MPTTIAIPETTNVARLIVCERSGQWAVALRRELADVGVRVWETRTLDGCRDELQASQASFVVVELRAQGTGGASGTHTDERSRVGMAHQNPRSSQHKEAVGHAHPTIIGGASGIRADELLRFLSQRSREFPDARIAVVADRSLANYDGLMREAGAVHFLCSPRQADVLARLACRHLAQVPPPVQSLTERMWANLPWA